MCHTHLQRTSQSLFGFSGWNIEERKDIEDV
jgi:hypothetical protein